MQPYELPSDFHPQDWIIVEAFAQGQTHRTRRQAGSEPLHGLFPLASVLVRLGYARQLA